MTFDRYAGVASAAFIVLIIVLVGWVGLWGSVSNSMTWTDLGEVIKVLGSMATALAALTGAYIAWRGLEKWRSETTGKHRSELAANVLAECYEMEEIIRSCRNPFVMVHEMFSIEGISDEVALDSSYAPERRLLEYQEFFGRFRSRKHEFAAVFGKAAASAHEEMWRLRLEINWAVDSMLRNKEIRNGRDPQNRELWLSWYNVAFRNSDVSQDPLIPRLQKSSLRYRSDL